MMFPWLYAETSNGFHSFLQRTAMPVQRSVMQKNPGQPQAPHQDVGQVRKGGLPVLGCRVSGSCIQS